MTKIRMICAYCTSDDVTLQGASAIWNVKSQTWVVAGLASSDEYWYCNACDGECDIREAPLYTIGAPLAPVDAPAAP